MPQTVVTPVDSRTDIPNAMPGERTEQNILSEDRGEEEYQVEEEHDGVRVLRDGGEPLAPRETLPRGTG